MDEKSIEVTAQKIDQMFQGAYPLIDEMIGKIPHEVLSVEETAVEPQQADAINVVENESTET